jgi:DNA-binding MarR family transcriptional regulator
MRISTFYRSSNRKLSRKVSGMVILRPVSNDRVDLNLGDLSRAAPELDAWPIAVSEQVSRLSALLEQQLGPVLAKYDLSAGEIDVLAALRRSGSPFRLTPTHLTAALMVTSGGMTKRLSALERAGLIRRVPSSEDRRSSAVELMDAGRELIERILDSRLKSEKRMFAGLRKKQRRDLAITLRDLCAALGDDQLPMKKFSRR